LLRATDIIHSGGIPIPLSIYRKPIIYTIHGDYRNERNVWRHLVPWAARHATMLTTPSDFLKDALHLDRAVVIPNAVSPQRFAMVEHRENQRINLVTVTGFKFIRKAEGVLQLIQLLGSLAAATRQRMHLTVVGGGKFLRHVESQAAGCALPVTFVGSVPDVRPFLGAGDVFVYYSFYDNAPMAWLEAMASGLPVLTNDIGAAAEYISPECGCVAANDDDYRELLLQLTDARRRAQLGCNARLAVENRFSWQVILPQFIALYHSVC